MDSEWWRESTGSVFGTCMRKDERTIREIKKKESLASCSGSGLYSELLVFLVEWRGFFITFRVLRQLLAFVLPYQLVFMFTILQYSLSKNSESGFKLKIEMIDSFGTYKVGHYQNAFSDQEGDLKLSGYGTEDLAFVMDSFLGVEDLKFESADRPGTPECSNSSLWGHQGAGW